MEDRNERGLTYLPLTEERWPEFEELFGPRGAYGGCWCMWWRLTRAQFELRQGKGNRQAMKALIEAGEVPGILLYDRGEAVGWCSVAPREVYGSLNRSPVLKLVDDRPVWSLVCLYVARARRDEGLMRALILAAIDFVRSQGGQVLEAYPTVPLSGELPPVSSYMGIPSVFAEAGFVEVSRPSRTKMIMRYEF